MQCQKMVNFHAMLELSLLTGAESKDGKLAKNKLIAVLMESDTARARCIGGRNDHLHG
jgi:hypothetical protein